MSKQEVLFESNDFGIKGIDHLKNIEETFWWYLAGIVDGEGYIGTGEKAYRTHGKYLQKHYEISATSVDKEMLVYLMETSGLGHLYPKRQHDRTNTCYYWIICRRAEVLEVAKLLHDKLRINRKREQCLTLIRNLETERDTNPRTWRVGNNRRVRRG
jgi:hypothetical protein